VSIKRHQAGKLFSAAVEHGGLVYVAGQVADDLTQGARGQTEQVLKKIDAILAAAGTGKSKILSANVWVTDIRNRDEMNAAWTAWADPANLPAHAGRDHGDLRQVRAGYFRQKAGVTTTNSVNSSRRPISMATVHTQV
jgi:enamine deaminase RidA (YjgF/YER057c/UK114 family)